MLCSPAAASLDVRRGWVDTGGLPGDDGVATVLQSGKGQLWVLGAEHLLIPPALGVVCPVLPGAHQRRPGVDSGSCSRCARRPGWGLGEDTSGVVTFSPFFSLLES